MTTTWGKDEAQMLATLAVKCRPTGARQWNPDAVMAEIAKVHDRSLPVVICAVIRAAADRNAQRPEVISSAGSHWGDLPLVTPPPTKVPANEMCSVCSLPRNACRMRWAHDHEFDSLAAAAKRKNTGTPEAMTTAITALRDAISAAERRPPAPKTLDDLERNPKVKARIDELRAALPPSPPMREPEPPAPDETSGEVGTGAGEGATGQDTGTAWGTRSEDCPEAPAQAHLSAPDETDENEAAAAAEVRQA